MDPEVTPAPKQAAPDTPTPVETQAEIDYRKRYEDLRPEFDRKSATAAEYERLRNGDDPEGLKAILDAYGYELEADEEPADAGLPGATTPVADPRIDEIAKWKAEQEQQQQQATINAEWDGWTEFVKDKAKTDHGVELTAREIKSFQLDSVGKDGLPVPPEKAEAVLKAYLAEREELVESLRKPRPRAPHIPAGGQAATGGKDPADMTRQELDRWMTDRLNAGAA